jgi:hypothetical protein
MPNHGLPPIIDEAAEQALGGLRDTIALVEGGIRQSTNVALDTGATRKTFGRRESVLKHLSSTSRLGGRHPVHYGFTFLA